MRVEIVQAKDQKTLMISSLPTSLNTKLFKSPCMQEHIQLNITIACLSYLISVYIRYAKFPININVRDILYFYIKPQCIIIPLATAYCCIYDHFKCHRSVLKVTLIINHFELDQRKPHSSLIIDVLVARLEENLYFVISILYCTLGSLRLVGLVITGSYE